MTTSPGIAGGQGLLRRTGRTCQSAKSARLLIRGNMALLAVKAAGLVTSVGFNYESTCAALRAGIRQATNAENLWDYESGSLIATARVLLPQWQEGVEKLPDLVAPAIHECLEAASPLKARDIPLLMGIAEAGRPCRWPGIDNKILAAVQEKLGATFHPASAVVGRGRVSTVVALQIARQLFDEQRVPCCIIAGVDSFLQQDVVEAFMSQRRVLTQANSNGFRPGEAVTPRSPLLRYQVQRGNSAFSGLLWPAKRPAWCRTSR